jgi:alpha-beta hydrolase superfamily lysophospholipase
VVQFVHGMAEHIDRYDEVARALCAAGIAAAGHNHLGHGRRADTKGYFADKNGWQHLVDDVHRLRGVVREQYPDVPYFLLGHSMGSFVVRCYLAQHAQGLQGAILTGTGHFEKGMVASALAVSRLICLFGGKKRPAALMDQLTFSGNNKPFLPARTDFDWLTRDEAMVDRYVADENCGFIFTGGAFRDLFLGIRRMNQPATVQHTPKELPLLFLSGDRDPVGGMGLGVEKVAQAYRSAGHTKVQLQLYPDSRHEVLNETDRAKVFRDVIIFVDECLSGAEPGKTRN